VPDDFVERCGLNVGSAPGATNWTLTARELQMFAQLLREGKGRGEIDVYTRPQIAVSDNQTGYAQVGQLFPLLEVGALVPAYANLGVTFRATPRVLPDGRILLRTEVQFGELVRTALTSTVPGIPFPVTHLGQQFNLRSLQTTAELKPGETLVARLGDKLVIITPTIVK
jgi:type II secretory pathway component GspD/PulD (secretin)